MNRRSQQVKSLPSALLLTPQSSITIPEGEIGCDVQEALTAYSCQSAGCHAAPTRSSLRLLGEALRSHAQRSSDLSGAKTER